MKVDTARPIVTPEGARLSVRVAGPSARASAWLLDLLIRFGIYSVAGILLSLLGGVGNALYLLLLFAGEWLYFTLYEGLRGATPGKRRMGLRVVRRDGAPCGLEAATIRNLVRFVDMLPPLYGFGTLSMLASPDFQRLGDRAADTLVTYSERDPDASRRTLGKAPLQPRRERAQRSEPQTVEPVAPPVALTGEEQAALLDFAERAEGWGAERQTELTDILSPLTGLDGEAGRKRVWAHAAWLEGSQA